MSADSLIGASVSNSLSQSARDLINSVLADTVSTGSSTPTTTQLSGAVLVQGTGANAEAQAVLAATQAFSGTVNFGSLNLEVQVAENAAITAEGPSQAVAAAQAASFFQGLIDAALPASATGALAAQRQALEKAVSLVTADTGGAAAVKFLQISDASAGAAEVKLTGSATGAQEVVAVGLSGVAAGKTVVLENLDKAIIVGQGAVRVSGSAPAFVAGDSANQSIAGGSGADTLVGGGGSDTLSGGAGSDLFGFGAGGAYTISDLGSGDKLAFSFAGLTSYAQLVSLVTGVTQGPSGTTYSFGSAGSITLVGISPSQISADLIQFTI